MANPSARVPSTSTPFSDNHLVIPGVTTAQTYWPGEAIGVNTSGYGTKCDDSASLLFAGIFADSFHKKVEAGYSAGDEELKLNCRQPRYGTHTIAAAAITDVGKLVYWTYSNEVSFSPGTYGNVAGRVRRYISSTVVLVEYIWGGSKGTAGVARTMAATGAQSLTIFDVNKTIFLPNTAAFTLTLPVAANVQKGGFLKFVKTTADAAAVTLDGDGAETIDGAATLATIDAINDCATLECDGSNWIVSSRDIT